MQKLMFLIKSSVSALANSKVQLGNFCFRHTQNRPGCPSVIPAKAGNQGNGMHTARLDSGFRRNDDFLSIAKTNTL